MMLSSSRDCPISSLLALSLVIATSGCVHVGRPSPQINNAVVRNDDQTSQSAIAETEGTLGHTQVLPAVRGVTAADNISLYTATNGEALPSQNGLSAVTTLEDFDSRSQPVVESDEIHMAGRQINSVHDEYLCQQFQNYQVVLGQLHDENALLSSRVASLEEQLSAADVDHRVRQKAAAHRIDSLSQELSLLRKRHADFEASIEMQQRRDLERLGEIADLIQILAEVENCAETNEATSTE